MSLVVVRITTGAFIAHRHAWHTDRDIVLPLMSVRLSVTYVVVLYVNECSCLKLFGLPLRGITLFSEPTAVTKFQGNPLSGRYVHAAGKCDFRSKS